MKKLACGVYQIKNTVNGSRYVGSSVDINARIRAHRSALRRSYHRNIYLQRAWNKYDEESFEFNILFYTNEKDVRMFEQRALDILQPEYNIEKEVSMIGCRLSEEAKQNMREAKKNISEETKQKMCIAHVGKHHTKETKLKIGLAQKGRMSPMYGKYHTEETKRKIGMAHKGKKHHMYGKQHSEETKRKMSKAQKLDWVKRKNTLTKTKGV